MDTQREYGSTQKNDNRKRNALEKQTRESPATESSFHEGSTEIGTHGLRSCFENYSVDASAMDAPGLSITSTTDSTYSLFTNSLPANSPSGLPKKNIPSPYTLPVSIESSQEGHAGITSIQLAICVCRLPCPTTQCSMPNTRRKLQCGREKYLELPCLGFTTHAFCRRDHDVSTRNISNRVLKKKKSTYYHPHSTTLLVSHSFKWLHLVSNLKYGGRWAVGRKFHGWRVR